MTTITPGTVGQHQGAAQQHRTERPAWSFTETKAGAKTTEFLLAVVFIAGILVATYMDEDSLGREDGWRYASFVAVAYLISRGLAKLGTREPYITDDRR